MQRAARAYGALVGPLRRLDARLAAALAAMEAEAIDPPGHRPVNLLDCDLTYPPGHPRFAAAWDATQTALTHRPAGLLARLRWAFGLSALELDLLLIALAPEIDVRYQRIFGVLGGDALPARASVDLALDLLCSTAVQKFHARAALLRDAPLCRHGLIRIDNDLRQPDAPALRGALVPDARIVAALFGATTLPGFLAFVGPTRAEARPASTAAVRLRLDAEDSDAPPDIVLEHAGRRRAPVLLADLRPGGDSPDDHLRIAVLEAALRGAVLCLRVDPLASEATRRSVLAVMTGSGRIDIILAGAADWPLSVAESNAIATLTAPPLAFGARLRLWQQAIAAGGIGLDEAQARILASRFRLGAAQIEAAAAATAAALRRDPGADALETAARAAKAGRARDLHGLARRLDTPHGWHDLILPAEPMAQLRAVCAQVENRHVVETDWDFASRLPMGRGISALFSGPSGTGKTMAAGIVARALHMDLFRVDLAQVVSKFIGETEKNLDRIFNAASRADAVLFFDEADTLFGRRTETRDSHDRYANLEVGYLLQKMEEYEGVAILATNLRQNLDDAFLRRLRFIVEFPFPDEAQRLAIWRAMFPPRVPLAADVDFPALAREIRLAGGHLRNIALAAAFQAAASGRSVTQALLLDAARDENRKLGRS